jgi:hypothetical protein
MTGFYMCLQAKLEQMITARGATISNLQNEMAIISKAFHAEKVCLLTFSLA